MKRYISLAFLFSFLLIISGCHTQQIVQAKSQSILRIAVATPLGASKGLYATLQSNALPEYSILGGSHKDSTVQSEGFNDLVLGKFPHGIVYNDYSAEVKRGLERKGFQIVDITDRANTVEAFDQRVGGTFKVTIQPLQINELRNFHI